MFSKRWYALVVVAIIMSMMVTACSPGGGSDSDVLKIGFVDPLTGPGAVFGKPQEEAVDMAIEEINNAGGVKVGDKTYKLELIKYDNKADANEAINATRKLIDRDGVKFILGGASSTPTLAVVQNIKDDDVLFLVGYAAEQNIVTQGNTNVFRNRTPSGYIGGPTGDAVYQDGVRTVAYLGQKDSVYQTFFKYFKDNFIAKGGKVLAEEQFGLGDRDMYTQLTKVINLKPDALIVPGYVEQAAFVYKQARELGYKGKIYGFTGGSKEQYLEIATNEQMQGIHDVRPEEIPEKNRSENNKKFFENFKKKYNKNPVNISLYAYDQVYVLKKALEEAGTTEVSEVINKVKEMEPPKEVTLNYMTVNGKMFDSNGQAYTPNVMLRWEGEDWKYLRNMDADVEDFSKKLSSEVKK